MAVNMRSSKSVRLFGTVAVLSVLCCLWMDVPSMSISMFPTQSQPEADAFDRIPRDQTPVLLFAYMKGGSTSVGQLLGHVPHVFYIYEPLLERAISGYYSIDGICSIKQHQCRHKIHEISGAIRNIKNNLRCNITARDISIMCNMGGTSWNGCKDCLDRNTSHHCKESLNRNCRKSQFVVSKVLRLSMSIVQRLMEEIDTLKVIYLLRDPRDIMASRQRMGQPFQDIEHAAESLCEKMYADYKIGYLLEKKFRNRFLTIKYESIVDDPLQSAIKMYNSINYPYMEHIMSMAKAQSGGNASTLASRWRNGDKKRIVEIVNRHCSRVYDVTGY